MTILNKEELEKWENSRDLLKEISKSVDEMISGIACRTTEVEVSEEIHNLRKTLDKPI